FRQEVAANAWGKGPHHAPARFWAIADRSVRDGGIGAVDRLHQHRESTAGAGRGAPARVSHSLSYGRQPGPHAAPALSRELALRASWRHARLGARCLVDESADSVCGVEPRRQGPEYIAGLGSALFCTEHHAYLRHILWTYPRLAGYQERRCPDAERASGEY